MNRTLGFFLGSAVVFVMLLLILGQPVSLAPPADREQPAAPDAGTTVAQIPQPEIQADAPSKQAPVPQVRESPATATEALFSVPVTAPDVAASSGFISAQDGAPASTGIEDQDENQLVESWLASTTILPADHADPGSAASAAEATAAVGRASDAAETPETEWFPVWDPFHSELSANAFARRLERVTGLDYRVIKTAPAQYR
ncbi:MAG: hypothetical protein KJO66_03265, partial [Gammaproteobacteria bacterium]|nr:hypothetical protein [Gammaproteobacteria bacterium]